MAFVPRARPENALGAPPGERPQSLKCLLSSAFGWAPRQDSNLRRTV